MKAQELLRQYGENRLLEKKKKTNGSALRSSLKDVMILILIAAAAISLVIAVYEGHGFLNRC
jgi:Ca2+-transporting ATPase